MAAGAGLLWVWLRYLVPVAFDAWPRVGWVQGTCQRFVRRSVGLVSVTSEGIVYSPVIDRSLFHQILLMS